MNSVTEFSTLSYCTFFHQTLPEGIKTKEDLRPKKAEWCNVVFSGTNSSRYGLSTQFCESFSEIFSGVFNVIALERIGNLVSSVQ